MRKTLVLIVGVILATLGVVTSPEAEEEGYKVVDTVQHELIFPHPEGMDLSVEQVVELKEPEIERVNERIIARKAEEERLRKEEEAKQLAQAKAEAEAKRLADAEKAKAEEARQLAIAQAEKEKQEAVVVQEEEKQEAEVVQERQVESSSTSQGSQPASSYLLAQLVESEATGEPYAGKVAVAEVVLNRVKDGGFPNSIEGVIYQSGQFQVVSNGRINMTPTQESINASNEALAGSNYTYGALYFYNSATATDRWQDSLRTTTVIGSHTFNAKN